MRARVASFLLVAVCSFGVISCTAERDAPTAAAEGLDDAVLPTLYYPFVPMSYYGPAFVSGCWWSNELGQIAGSWGTPTGGKPYPNPTNGSVVCWFTLPEGGEVIWWLEKAYGPGEQPPEASGQYAGSTMTEPTAVLLGPSTEFHTAGLHAIGWDGRDQFGSHVSEGYYRIYAQVPALGLTGWWDILIDRD